MNLLKRAIRLLVCYFAIAWDGDALVAQGWEMLFWEDIHGQISFWKTDTGSRSLSAQVVQDSTTHLTISENVRWDSTGKPISLEFPGRWLELVQFEYDLRGTVTTQEEHYSDGQIYKYSYTLNARNKVVAVHCVRERGEPVLDAIVAYHSGGKLKRMVICYHDSTIIDALLHKAQGLQVPITARYTYRYKGNRMYEKNLDTGRTFTYTFDGSGRLLTIHYGRDMVREYTYDRCGGLASSILIQQGTGVVLEEYRILRSENCVLTGLQRRNRGEQGFTSWTVRYE